MPEHFAYRMQLIDLADAVGMALAHDITEIRPGEFKGAAFKKGQIITQQDLDHLARLGKRHLYVVEISDSGMHEDEAALKLAEALSGPGITFKPKPCEGKINLFAARDGLLKVNVAALTDFNLVDGIMCASIHNNTLVRERRDGCGHEGYSTGNRTRSREQGCRSGARLWRCLHGQGAFPTADRTHNHRPRGLRGTDQGQVRGRVGAQTEGA